MYEYNFEKLEIWKLAFKLTTQIYTTTKKFPPSERFGLISQLRRAASSIPANIAEGVSRFGKKDRARFIEIAYGSTIEVMNHLILSKELKMIDESELLFYREKINELSNKLNAFYNNIKK
ncbi:MAG: four helix bundle protein [Saprospiraceae bacterium]|nr:four helix bundle protein [Saprospiraceae bacterium]MCZ2336711.1 four helix bundle protein [Chitinophagales bacterium]